MAPRTSRVVYSVTDIATVLAVSARTVVDWIRVGKLQAIDVSTARDSKRPTYRVARPDLLQFLIKLGLSSETAGYLFPSPPTR